MSFNYLQSYVKMPVSSYIPTLLPQEQAAKTSKVSEVRIQVLVLEKWFPLQGERAKSVKVFNVRMLGFKNKMRNEKEETEQQQTNQFTAR